MPLPPSSDGVLYLIGDSTLKEKRGRKHPLGHTPRHSEHDPYTFGFEMVLLIASWARQVVVIADAGFAAHATMCLIAEKKYGYVFAMPRTRKFTNGKHLRDLVQHLPKSCSYRRASSKPDGRRQDYWVFVRHATLHNLGDVTIVLSKKRRNTGPK